MAANLEALTTRDPIKLDDIRAGPFLPRPGVLNAVVYRYAAACASRAALPNDPASSMSLLSLSAEQRGVVSSMSAPDNLFMPPCFLTTPFQRPTAPPT